MVRSLGFLALLTGSAFGAALEARDQPSAGVSSSVGPSSTWTWPSGPKPTTSQGVYYRSLLLLSLSATHAYHIGEHLLTAKFQRP